MADPLPLVRGTLDALVLKALTWTPMHGFEITTWLEERSAGSLDVQDSALYQALQRLEDRGHVRAEWGMTENNRRARYYALTPAGRRHLREDASTWMQFSRAVTLVLSAEPAVV